MINCHIEKNQFVFLPDKNLDIYELRSVESSEHQLIIFTPHTQQFSESKNKDFSLT